MPSTPEYELQFTSTITEPIDQVNPEGIHIHDELDLLPTTSSRPLPRKSPHSKPKKVNSKWKGKRVRDLTLSDEGECPLLNLPEDIVHTLLSRIPPKDLTRLAVTCRDLYEELQDETIWRQSYINRFLYDGAARNNRAKEDVKVLVQGCLNNGGRGWKREALSREAMINRWTDSKASMVIHTPPAGLIHSLSLSYPPFIPPPAKSLVVGKNHQTPTKGKTSPTRLATTPSTSQPINAEASTSDLLPTPDDASSSTPTKMTHRQKYEAILAATTRPPPHVLSASLTYGGVVRSDPISGKVSKGFWGPGRDANFHLRPHLDHSAEPSSLYIPTRTQSFILWGLRTGSCVHTGVQSRHHATHGGRASSINVSSEILDSHHGEITDIWAYETDSLEPLRWVTGGEDGKVKLWEYIPGSGNRSGKRSPNDMIAASIKCLFSSEIVDTPFENRSDASKRRQNGRPDPIHLARYDPIHDVACGVTVDGDLRVWFSASSQPEEIRVDVGSEENDGGVKSIHLDVKKLRDEEIVASVLVQHRRSPGLTQYTIGLSSDVSTKVFITPTGFAISTVYTSFRSTPPISGPSSGARLSARIITPSETPEPVSPILEAVDALPTSNELDSNYGRFLVAGDETGYVHIWPWDGDEGITSQYPIRSWEAMNGKVTAIDYSCGLVAIGSFDGYIKVYDPLPNPPNLLRTFHASRLSPGELLVAASEEPDARYYTVNKVILENDLIVASIGRKVFAWRAGSGKGRQGGKESGWRRTSGTRGDGKGSSRGLDMKAIHRAAVDDHSDLESPTAKITSRHEAREVQAMEDMGFNGDDALQYALMLSMEEQNNDHIDPETGECEDHVESSVASTSTRTPAEGTGEVDDGMDEETREAIRQVEAFKKQEEEELSKVLEMIRLSEENSQ